MANRVFLNCCDIERTFPNNLPGFDAKKHVIASCSNALPMLWLGLFRVEDLRLDIFETEEKSFIGDVENIESKAVALPAPITDKEKALAQLSQSLEKFDALFAESGSVAKHIEYLSAAVSAAEGKYVSIDYLEISYIQFFLDAVVSSLWYLGGGSKENVKEHLLYLAAIEPGRPFYPPPGVGKREDIPIVDKANFVRLLGFSWLKDVPWE